MEKIAEILPSITVQHGTFLEYLQGEKFRELEVILPKGPITEKLQEYISDTPLKDFIYESLTRELQEGQAYSLDATPIALTSIEAYGDAKAAAERLVREFESLPRNYTLTFPLGGDFGLLFAKAIKHYTFDENAVLVVADKELINQFPLKSGIKSRDERLGYGDSPISAYIWSLRDEHPVEWDTECSYLQVKVSGFIGYYGTTESLREAVSVVKAFCGMGFVGGLFRKNYAHPAIPGQRARCLIHRKTGDKWVIESQYKLETEFSDTFNALTLGEYVEGLESEPAKTIAALSRLTTFRNLLANEPRSEAVFLAVQWLFEGYCGDDDLLSFVKTVIVLEILFGNKTLSDKIGLGELLGNRCAFLIGETHKDRQEILGDFKQIYDVRCEIVHRGKNRLSETERDLLWRLRSICRRVIRKEMELFEKEVPRPVYPNFHLP